jgi:hypothetical protein
MATQRARLYAFTGKNPKREPSGQAARVLLELRANREPRLAEDIDLAIATSDTPHKTRQDSLRVTLYYLLVFKKVGIVEATPQPIAEEPVAADEPEDAEDAETELEDETIEA